MRVDTDFTHNLARKGTPNLYLGAAFLEPDDKFRAFLAAYAAMRLTDDLIDDNRAEGAMGPREKAAIAEEIGHFAEMFRRREINDTVPYAQEIKLALVHFELPVWPFIELAEAMRFDLENDRFDNFRQFVEYAEGAAVAPAAVFMHLAACRFDDRGQLIPPPFDIRQAARPLALFAYLVHILRDFKKDFVGGRHPLIYIDLETTDMFFIGETEMAETARTGRQSLKFTKMVKWYYNRLTEYQVRAHDALNRLDPLLPADGRFALALIYELYAATAQKISDHGYILVRQDLNLERDKITAAARRAARRNDMDEEYTEKRLLTNLKPNPATG